MAPPTVDILIVTFNGREEVRDCLRSLREHPTSPTEAVVRVRVLDNGSTDGTPDMIAAEFPEVELERSAENLGFARGNNHLAETSTADHLLLLNPDVVLTEELVGPLLRRLQADPSIAIVAPRLVYPDGRPQHSAPDFPNLPYEYAAALRGSRLGRALRPVFDSEARMERVERRGGHADEADRDADFLWATCWLLRRADVERHGLFDREFSMYDEDLDFCRRAREQGRRLVYVPSVTLVHVGGASSTSAAKRAMLRRARRRYYRRHGGPVRAAAYGAGLPLVDRAIRVTDAIPRPRRR